MAVVTCHVPAPQPLDHGAQPILQESQAGPHFGLAVISVPGGLHRLLLLWRVPGAGAGGPADRGQGQGCPTAHRQRDLCRDRLRTVWLEHLARAPGAQKGHGAIRGAEGTCDVPAAQIRDGQAVEGEFGICHQHGRGLHLRNGEPGEGEGRVGERAGVGVEGLVWTSGYIIMMADYSYLGPVCRGPGNVVLLCIGYRSAKKKIGMERNRGESC